MWMQRQASEGCIYGSRAAGTATGGEGGLGSTLLQLWGAHPAHTFPTPCPHPALGLPASRLGGGRFLWTH